MKAGKSLVGHTHTHTHTLSLSLSLSLSHTHTHTHTNLIIFFDFCWRVTLSATQSACLRLRGDKKNIKIHKKTIKKMQKNK